MLTTIGLMPATYALNLDMTSGQIGQAAKSMQTAAELIERAGGQRKEQGVSAARSLGGLRISRKSVIFQRADDQRSPTS